MSVSTHPIGPERTVAVSLGALLRPTGEVLLAWRSEARSPGGCWELPGGKREPGEDSFAALLREVDEETGIRIGHARPLISVPFGYAASPGVPAPRIRLDCWLSSEFSPAEPDATRNRFRWVPLSGLREVELPAANRGIVAALQLPEIYLVTGPYLGDTAGFLGRLEGAACRGVRLVYLRPGPLAGPDDLELTLAAVDRLRGFGAKLLVRDRPDLCEATGAAGVHLSSARLKQLSRRPIGSDRLLGASCHDALELALARRLEVDFAVLSPVLGTSSHPGASELGWDGFARLVADAGLPVYALGGLGPRQLGDAWAAGGQGIAGTGAFWS